MLGAEIVRVAGHEDAAPAEEHDGVRDGLDVGDEMRGDDDEGVRGVAAQDRVEDRVAGGRVDARNGLIQQVHLRPTAHRQRQLHLLALPTRQALQLALGVDPERIHQRSCAGGVEIGEEVGEHGQRRGGGHPVG